MNSSSVSFLRLSVVSLLIVGCSQPEPSTPPIMSAINDMKSLEDSKKAAAQAARANSVLQAPGSSPSVPQEGTFTVEFDTTVGKFTVEVHREWSPHGANRFHELIADGFYNGAAFFRVLPGFMVQWGMAADPGMTAKWDKTIPDDPVIESNLRGYITYAKPGTPDSRTAQVFINYGDNSRLDADGFTPFGKVIAGMDVVEKISAAHREEPNQGAIEAQGNAYLKSNFPNLDYIKTATFVKDDQPDSDKPVLPAEPGPPVLPGA